MNTLALEFIPQSIKSVWDHECEIVKIEMPAKGGFLDLIEPFSMQLAEQSSGDDLNSLPSSINDYSKYLKLIYSELEAQKLVYKNYNQYNARPIKRRNCFWEFILPGLADSSPMINEGDWAIVRIYHTIGNVSIVQAEYHTRILVVIRKDNRIIIPMDSNKFKSGAFCACKFLPSGVKSLLMASSVAYIHSHPKLFDSSLYPKKFYKQIIYPNYEYKQDNDENLNEYQELFMERVLHRTQLAMDGYKKDLDLDLPMLLIGPFGTGKTITFANTLKRISEQFENSKILAIAPSESAADTIALKLLSIGMDPKKIFRFNNSLRDIFTLPRGLTAISSWVNDSFSIPDNFLEYSIVVCTTYESELLDYYGFSNSKIEENRKKALENVDEQLKMNGLPSYEYQNWRVHWTHLGVDEAAQATETSLASAFKIVATEYFNSQIILAGDPQQLGPQLTSTDAANSGLALSLLERLSMNSYYKNSNSPIVTLRQNYRSHPALLMMPSALFYFKDLIPRREQCENDFSYFSRVPSYSYTKISELQDLPHIYSKWPFLFYPVRGKEQHGYLENHLTAGWWNGEEALVVLLLIEKMIANSGPSIKNEIGIMTISRRQVAHIRNVLRDANLSEINVGTVEDYQGMERKYIFLSTVRVSESHVDQDIKRNVGLVEQHKRLNVALSRAQDLLIIIGSPKHLVRDLRWRQILYFCDRNGLWINQADKEDEIDSFSKSDNLILKRNLSSESVIGSKPISDSEKIIVSDLENSLRTLKV